MGTEHSHCFLPDGSIFDGDRPCFPDKEASPCCGPEWTCLTNGLCYHGERKQLVRGSCTDHAWVSTLCPQFCTKNEYDGQNISNFSVYGVITWGCSDKWPGEGGLMCCDVASTSSRFNRSCCPGINAVNLFSIGSELGTAKSITLSSSPSFETSFSPSFQSSSAPLPRLSLSNDVIYVDGSSFSALSPPTARSSTEFTSTNLSQSPGPNTKSSFESTSTIEAARNHIKVNGSTIAIAVSTSIGAVVLIVVSILVYRRFGKKRQKSSRSPIEDPDNQVIGSIEAEQVYDPQELLGHQDHELPASPRYLRQELPGAENQFHALQELSR